MANDVIQKVRIDSLDVENPFFNSLRDDYPGFNSWLSRKGGEDAYVLVDNNQLLGFLYLKDEEEADDNITPSFGIRRRLKIGTFKINPHGTVLGQRFLSIILRRMLNDGYDFTYVTLFPKQTALINLFEKFGFRKWGTKNNGELVYYKNLEVFNDIYRDFPRLSLQYPTKKYLLSIFPRYHTKMFPESQLRTERHHHVEDLSVTNSSEKIYISAARQVPEMRPGDHIVIYRTAEEGIPAEFSSVASTICTVSEVRQITDFDNFDNFLEYCGRGTIFSQEELQKFWQDQYPRYIIKMLYNVSLNKRIIRRDLRDSVGINAQRWTCVELSDNQFRDILEMGKINESFIIN
jgi:hypothetical protein